MTPVARAVVAFVLVAGAGPAGFLIYHAVFNKQHPLRSQVAPAASAPASAPVGPPIVGTRPAPVTLPEAVALPDAAGTLHHLADYRGKPLVLNFWATWCEPCRREIPLLEALHRDPGNPVQIVGVAVDFKADVVKYARTQGITYPLLMGEQDGLAAVDAFGMDTAFPFTVFADAQGNIVAVKRGELHGDEARLIVGELAALDAGRERLSEARAAVSEGLRNLAIARSQQSPQATVPAG